MTLNQASNPYVGRYAPTPSGSLHLGNLRTAFAAWLHARHHHGKFYLRIDDIDTDRVKPEKIAEHQRDLHRIGIDWDCANRISDEPFLQSDHLARYESACRKISAHYSVYPCVCSRKTIRDYWQECHGIDSVVYPGLCWQEHRMSSQHGFLMKEKSRCRRFHLGKQKRTLEDRFAGEIRLDLCEYENAPAPGDFILRRSDGVLGYMFVCAIDDGGYLGVNHILRGDDLAESAIFQTMVMRALDLPEPVYMHIPVMTGEGGRKLSKRDGDDDLTHYLDQGFTTDQIRNYLAWTLGQIENGEMLSTE